MTFNRKEYIKQWRKNNPDRIKSYNQKWRKSNPEYHKQWSKEYKKSHPEVIKRLNDKWHNINGNMTIQYKNKLIYLGFDPRIYTCALCRKQGKTNLHHIKYHDDDVLKDTIELCTKCHRIIHTTNK